MRIQVLHGSAGDICAILAPTEGAREGGIRSPSPDRFVIEVEAPDVTLPADVTEVDPVAATLAHLTEHYVVRAGRLVERSAGS